MSRISFKKQDEFKYAIEHPFFKTSMNQSSIHWITTHDSVLIAKSKIDKLEKHKVAAFDLVNRPIKEKKSFVLSRGALGWHSNNYEKWTRFSKRRTRLALVEPKCTKKT